mgnify:CR=1 FL=1
MCKRDSQTKWIRSSESHYTDNWYVLERFQTTVEKPKQLLRPITIGAGSAMNQSQLLAITCNSLEAREKSRVRGAIGFGFDSH